MIALTLVSLISVSTESEPQGMIPESANGLVVVTSSRSPDAARFEGLSELPSEQRNALNKLIAENLISVEVAEMSKGEYIIYDRNIPLTAEILDQIEMLALMNEFPFDRGDVRLGDLNPKLRSICEKWVRRIFPDCKDEPLPDSLAVNFSMWPNFETYQNGVLYSNPFRKPNTKIGTDARPLPRYADFRDEEKLNAHVQRQAAENASPKVKKPWQYQFRASGMPAERKQRMTEQAMKWTVLRLEELRMQLEREKDSAYRLALKKLDADGKLPKLGQTLEEIYPEQAKLYRERAEANWKEMGFPSQEAAIESAENQAKARVAHLMFFEVAYIDRDGSRSHSSAPAGHIQPK